MAFAQADLNRADILIVNGYVVTMNSTRAIYESGAVAIRDGKIVGVGSTADITSKHKGKQVIDAEGMLVIPGLIDGHNHPNQYLSKGIGDDVHISVWLQRILAYEAHMTEDDMYVCALGNFAEMIRSGTTCFNEPGSFMPNAIGAAARDIGMRGILTRSTMDQLDKIAEIPAKLKEDRDTLLTRAQETVRHWNGAENGRLRAWYSLRHATSVSDGLAKEIKDLAARDKVGIHCHAAVGEYENEYALERYGKRSLERVYDLGLFAPNLYLVHMGAANDREIGWLAKEGVKVAHCPSASMFGSYGVIQNKKIPEMIKQGVMVSLGTDSATAGRFLDMVRCMYLAACAHKDAYVDASVMGAYKALEMATIDGAKACLWDDEIGSLETGKRADLTLISMRDFAWKPCSDPIRTLIYCANGSCADTVIIDGRVVMKSRELTTVDTAWLLRAIKETARAVLDRAHIKVDLPWPVH